LSRLIVLLLAIYLVLALVGYLDECRSLQRRPATRSFIIEGR